MLFCLGNVSDEGRVADEETNVKDGVVGLAVAAAAEEEADAVETITPAEPKPNVAS